jgi:hypothetical protein
MVGLLSEITGFVGGKYGLRLFIEYRFIYILFKKFKNMQHINDLCPSSPCTADRALPCLAFAITAVQIFERSYA